MKKTVAKPQAEERGGFLFLGNQLALDFLNTHPVVNGEAIELLPDFTAVLRWLLAAGVLEARAAARLRQAWQHTARTQRSVAALRAFRERLRQAVFAWEEGKSIPAAMIAELNRLMAAYPMLSRVRSRKTGAEIDLWFEPRRPEELVAPIAHAAAALFAAADRARVRKCSNCVLHFQDISKKGARRWCSMQLCGNRFKVAAYAARQRSAR